MRTATMRVVTIVAASGAAMIFSQGSIDGAYVIDLERREDDRGFFARVWCDNEMGKHGLASRIRQINTGYSRMAGTLRGMHFQRPPHEEAKVVRCLSGAVYDVAVDLRPESETFGRWMGVDLSADNGRSFYIPEGCAHGYQTLQDHTVVMYLTSVAYAAQAAGGVRYDDPSFAISWPRVVTAISEADKSWPDFRAGPSR